MQVEVKVCRMRCKCKFCPEMIETGEVMVNTTWTKKWPDGKMWIGRYHHHIKCWAEEQEIRARSRPVVETRGRNPSSLDPKTKSLREAVMRRRGAVIQRLKGEMSRPESEISFEHVSHLGDMLEKLKLEIEPLGGVPKSWE